MIFDRYRRTGRTTQMIKDLPPDCIVVVHIRDAVQPMHERIKELRGKDFKARVICLAQLPEALMGVRNRIRIDHFVYEFISESKNKNDHENFSQLISTQYFCESYNAQAPQTD